MIPNIADIEVLSTEMRDKYIGMLKEVGGNQRVLYVEDDKATNRLLTFYLKRFFLRVDSAEDGIEALELYKHKRYDIVITDIEMPNMNGLELSKQIRKLNSNQRIIITTSNDDAEYMLSAIRLGVSDYVFKPIDYTELLLVVYRVAQQLEDMYMQDKYIGELLESNATLSVREQELVSKIKELEFENQKIRTAKEMSLIEETIQYKYASKNMSEKINKQAISEVDETMLLKKVQSDAATFIASLLIPPESKIATLQDCIESLEEIIDKIAKGSVESNVCSHIAHIILECSSIIDQFFEFRDIAFSLEKLRNALVEAQTSDNDLDWKNNIMLQTGISNIAKNINEWVSNIFIYKRAIDIHYMDDSFMCDVGMVENMVRQSNQPQECDIELF